jgi:3-deoxy-D-arabino-heptulosonate 7-phosphate (DAHP) synthase class II
LKARSIQSQENKVTTYIRDLRAQATKLVGLLSTKMEHLGNLKLKSKHGEINNWVDFPSSKWILSDLKKCLKCLKSAESDLLMLQKLSNKVLLLFKTTDWEKDFILTKQFTFLKNMATKERLFTYMRSHKMLSAKRVVFYE